MKTSRGCHSFLAPRTDEKGPAGQHVFDCLHCDGTMSPIPVLALNKLAGWWWRDTPEAEWVIWHNGPCPNTRDRAAEARQKMIDDFRKGLHTGPWDDAA